MPQRRPGRAGPAGGRTPSSGRAAALAAVVGGALWAATPLRDRLVGGGSDPLEGLVVFRGYNALAAVVALLLVVAAREAFRRSGRRSGRRWGWVLVIAGHGLVLVGSAVGAVLGDRARDVVVAGQDAGFLGAMVAALGGCVAGVVGLRRRSLPRVAAVLFALALPVGVLALVLLPAVGVPVDLLGLPLTGLYGGAWVALGSSWWRASRT